MHFNCVIPNLKLWRLTTLWVFVPNILEGTVYIVNWDICLLPPHTQIQTHTDTCRHSHTHIHRHTDTQAHANTHTHTHTHTCRHSHTQTHRHSRTLTHARTHAHTHTHTHTHTHRHTGTHTHSHTHKRTHTRNHIQYTQTWTFPHCIWLYCEFAFEPVVVLKVLCSK